MTKSNEQTHVINQSCLYKLKSKKKLAKILHVSLPGLESIANSTDRYSSWQEAKESGGFRSIDAPHERLKSKQKRIANILQKISPPDFLMAPVKGRSYVSNAAVHTGGRAFRLLDIENFFPSCTDKRVYWFFNSVMLCEPDVSAILTKLATHKGCLPQGSPCSPILAFFAYQNMWHEIDRITTEARCTLSVYADDITISGDVIYEKDIWAIKECLHRFGLDICAKKERKTICSPVNVTGVIVRDDKILLPNKQHKKLVETRRAINRSKNSAHRELLSNQLRGRVAQANQISQH